VGRRTHRRATCATSSRNSARDPGKLSPEEYDSFVRDTVISSSTSPSRRSCSGVAGLPVIAFLIFFTLLAYALKKEYWKDVK